jgi:competence protein ComEA
MESGTSHTKLSQQVWAREHFARQNTAPCPVVTSSTLQGKLSPETPLPPDAFEITVPQSNVAPETMTPLSNETTTPQDGQKIQEDGKKPALWRAIALLSVILLAVLLYFVWQPLSSKNTPAPVTRQISTPISTVNDADTQTSITAYIVGAVKRPGIYKLPTDARVHNLLEAAGGPLPNANLIALNLAARLYDGQEVYVAMIGEKPPTLNSAGGSGTLININTATAEELEQRLAISATTARTIINHRTTYGPYESVEQLASILSKTIYDKIKDKVTV